MIIKSVRVLSLGKILGSIYCGLGLIFGIILAGVSLIGLSPLADGAGAPPAVAGILLGGGAVIALPLLYGFFGLVAGLLVGTIYNFVAKIVGGLEFETD
jgi:hypothetical protein